MDIARRQIEIVASFVSEHENLKVDMREGQSDSEVALEVLKGQIGVLKKIHELALSLMEPLSFQDLVGQRIQRITRLVGSVENRIQDLVISFGIKIQRHKEDPTKSFEDLSMEVENFKSLNWSSGLWQRVVLPAPEGEETINNMGDVFRIFYLLNILYQFPHLFEFGFHFYCKGPYFRKCSL